MWKGVPLWTKAVADQRGCRRNDRCPTTANRLDDLAVVDSLEVDRSHTKVRVSELTLDNVDRKALPRHLDRMCMTQLVRSEAPSDASLQRPLVERRPRV
jgi:hypothetical protein